MTARHCRPTCERKAGLQPLKTSVTTPKNSIHSRCFSTIDLFSKTAESARTISNNKGFIYLLEPFGHHLRRFIPGGTKLTGRSNRPLIFWVLLFCNDVELRHRRALAKQAAKQGIRTLLLQVINTRQFLHRPVTSGGQKTSQPSYQSAVSRPRDEGFTNPTWPADCIRDPSALAQETQGTYSTVLQSIEPVSHKTNDML